MGDERIVIRAMGGGEELCAPVRGVSMILWAAGVHVELLGRERVVIVTRDHQVEHIASRAGIETSAEMVEGKVIDAHEAFGGGEIAAARETDRFLEFARAWVDSDPSSDLLFRQAARCALWDVVAAGGVAGVICDVDGTLTDGRVIMPGDGGGAGRAFSTHDGLGTQLVMRAGVRVGWLSATGDGGSIDGRAGMVGVEHVDWGHGEKGERVKKLCGRMGVDPARVVYIGDDVNDLPAMAECGASACPGDAALAVRREATLVLERGGGRGAFRELAEVILATI